MVLSPLNLCAVAAVSALLGMQTASAVDSFPVASFDFFTLGGDASDTTVTASLIEQLETTGIVSIRNIPFYAQLREQYLKVATECVNSGTSGLLHKELQDGTERFTISTKAQYHNPEIAATSVDCAAYLPTLRGFSALIDEVALQFARTLDAAAFSAQSEDSLEAIVKTAEHLDHFHEYTSAASAATGSGGSEAPLSLNLHTDNGVMIFMSAPEFYAIQAERAAVKSVSASAMVSGPTQSAGLLTYVPATGEVKQPILERDELVVMIGEGLRAWTSTSHSFPAVLHGMKMPTFSAELGKVARSWFGKMILMPKDRVIKDTTMTFGEYTNKTTDYVVGASDASAFSNSACPSTMELVASDDACSFDVYEPKPEVTDEPFTKEDCLRECNFMGNPACQEKCVYVATVPNRGLDCWMLCTPRDICPFGQQPSCDPSGALSVVCN